MHWIGWDKSLIYFLFRSRYIYGHDLYDQMWYLGDSDWPDSNLTLLHNELQQAGWDGPFPDEGNWRMILCQRLGKIDWKNSVADVKAFLERTAEAELLTPENFGKLLNCSLG